MIQGSTGEWDDQKGSKNKDRVGEVDLAGITGTGNRWINTGSGQGTKIIEDQAGEDLLMNERTLYAVEKAHSDVVLKKAERRFNIPSKMIDILQIGDCKRVREVSNEIFKGVIG